jgi:DNA-binding response OmpR family regulator
MEPTKASAPMQAGFTVVGAENGRQALEFAREFRPIRPSVPILFITGRGLPERSASGDAWDEDVLRKPFAAEVFLDAVTRSVSSSSVSPAS